MRRRTLVAMMAIPVLGLVAALVWRATLGPMGAVSGDSASQLSPGGPDRKGGESIALWLQGQRELLAQTERTRTPEAAIRDAAEWARRATIQEAAIADIDFVGRVLDQDGQPVPGVEVQYSGAGTYLAAGSGVGRTRSDGQGLFRIRTRGAELRIEALRKTGYEYRFDGEAGRFFGNRGGVADPMEWSDYTEAHPYLFNIWRLDSGARVATGERLLMLDRDGTPFTLDLPAASGKLLVRGATEGDLIITVTARPDGWHLVLRVPEGGLLDNPSPYAALAPEAGYLGQLEFDSQDIGLREFRRRLYLRSRGGGRYAHLGLEVSPLDPSGKAVILLNYAFNIDGGRQLRAGP